MQEDIENRTVSIMVSGSKFTGRMLKSAILKLLHHMRNRHRQHKDVIPHGKQTVKQLVGQNAGVSNIEVTDEGIKRFQRIAGKYGVDFAIKKVKGDNPRHLVFFKARDADALTAAFEEYTKKSLKKDERPSVLGMLSKFKALLAGRNKDQVKNKDKEISR